MSGPVWHMAQEKPLSQEPVKHLPPVLSLSRHSQGKRRLQWVVSHGLTSGEGRSVQRPVGRVLGSGAGSV